MYLFTQAIFIKQNVQSLISTHSAIYTKVLHFVKYFTVILLTYTQQIVLIFSLYF